MSLSEERAGEGIDIGGKGEGSGKLMKRWRRKGCWGRGGRGKEIRRQCSNASR